MNKESIQGNQQRLVPGVRNLLRKNYRITKAYFREIRFSLGALLRRLKGKALEKQFRREIDRSNLVSLFPISSGANISEIGKHISANKSKETIRMADDVSAHIFNLLGSERISLGEKIDWHRDFKSGQRWDLQFYARLIALEPPMSEYPQRKVKYDGKVPYELSRFQHFGALGQAYWLTGDEKYTKEFIRQIDHWIENNPMPYGVNWTCTMEVAIRACNWIWGLSFFRDSKEITEKFLLRFLQSLYEHGTHIRSNLENKMAFTSNHYLSDIVGLLYLSVIFPEIEEARGWGDFALNELKKEMDKQIYADGCDFEGSTCYHRLALELFFFATLVRVINDHDFDGKNYKDVSEKIFKAEYTARLYKMFEAVLYLLKPNGRMPQIGDNDSGRLHRLGDSEILDMRYLLTLGAIFFAEPRFKIDEFGFSEEAWWIFGDGGYQLWQGMKGCGLRDIPSKAFPQAGWYVLRHDKDYCIVSCGPNGQNGNGGHAHNDKLSFELMLDGEDIIVDPGTYVYTQDLSERNRFRSTRYHNTIAVEGQEQSKLTLDPFYLGENVQIKKSRLTEKNSVVIFNAKIEYGGIVHTRTISLDANEGSLKIADNLSCPRNFKADLLFHLSPDMTCKDNTFFLKRSRERIASIDIPRNILKKEVYLYSSAYGEKTESECCLVNLPAENQTLNISTVIKKIKNKN